MTEEQKDLIGRVQNATETTRKRIKAKQYILIAATIAFIIALIWFVKI